jgi:hypothetical protein
MRWPTDSSEMMKNWLKVLIGSDKIKDDLERLVDF